MSLGFDSPVSDSGELSAGVRDVHYHAWSLWLLLLLSSLVALAGPELLASRHLPALAHQVADSTAMDHCT